MVPNANPWTSIQLEPALVGTGSPVGAVGRASATYKNHFTVARFQLLESKSDITILSPSGIEFLQSEALENLRRLIKACYEKSKSNRGFITGRVNCPGVGDTSPPLISSSIVQRVPRGTAVSPKQFFYSQVTLDGLLAIKRIWLTSTGRGRGVHGPFDLGQNREIFPQLVLTPDFEASLMTAVQIAPPFPSDRDRQNVPKVNEIRYFPYNNFQPDEPRILGFYEIVLNTGTVLRDIALYGLTDEPKWVIYPSNYTDEGKITYSVLPDQALRSVVENCIYNHHSELKAEAATSGLSRVKKTFPYDSISRTVNDITFSRPEASAFGVKALISFTLNHSLRINDATLFENGRVEYPVRRRRQVRLIPVVSFETRAGDEQKIRGDITKAFEEWYYNGK